MSERFTDWELEKLTEDLREISDHEFRDGSHGNVETIDTAISAIRWLKEQKGSPEGKENDAA